MSRGSVAGLWLVLAAVATCTPFAEAENFDLALEETRLASPDGGGWHYFGTGVGAGDVDGDGLTDLVVGEEGVERAYLFLGTSTGISQLTHQVLEPKDPLFPDGFGYFGARSAMLDADADGHADVVISTSWDIDWVYVYRGGPAGVDPDSERRLDGPLEAPGGTDRTRFGNQLANAGDTDGDGFPELLVGAMGWSRDGEFTDGAIFLYPGSPEGLDRCGERRLSAPSVADNGLLNQFGSSFAGGADINGDGYADAAGVCVQCGNGGWGYEIGETYVWHGGPDGAGGEAPEILDACCSVTLAPDLDGDGFDDLLVGYQGTYAFYGGPLGVGAEEPRRISAIAATGQAVGDVDGDGLGDLLLVYTDVSLVFGDPGRPEDPPALFVTDETDGFQFTHGDFDGDGLSDFTVPAAYEGSFDGAVYAYSAACTRYRDADGDGAGDAALSVAGCEALEGYVAHADDCDDADATTQGSTWYPDADGDGWGVSEGAVLACAQPAGLVATRFDCDDADPAVNPEAADECADGVDNDCDGWDGPFDPRWACGDDTGTFDDCPGDTAGAGEAVGPAPKTGCSCGAPGGVGGLGMAVAALAAMAALRRGTPQARRDLG